MNYHCFDECLSHSHWFLSGRSEDKIIPLEWISFSSSECSNGLSSSLLELTLEDGSSHCWENNELIPPPRDSFDINTRHCATNTSSSEEIITFILIRGVSTLNICWGMVWGMWFLKIDIKKFAGSSFVSLASHDLSTYNSIDEVQYAIRDYEYG